MAAASLAMTRRSAFRLFAVRVFGACFCTRKRIACVMVFICGFAIMRLDAIADIPCTRAIVRNVIFATFACIASRKISLPLNHVFPFDLPTLCRAYVLTMRQTI